MSEAKVEAGAKPKKKILLFIIIGVVVLLILAAGALFLLISLNNHSGSAAAPEAHAEAAPAKAEKKKIEVGHGVGPIFEKLPQFTVNLDSENGEVMQTDIVVEVADAHEQEVIKALMPKIQSDINRLLSSKKPEEVKAAVGRDALGKEIKETINKIIHAEGDDAIVSVNFTSFIVR